MVRFRIRARARARVRLRVMVMVRVRIRVRPWVGDRFMVCVRVSLGLRVIVR